MTYSKVIDSIREVAAKTLPQNSSLLLYGSRARGNAHEGSDWDLLILLDKSKIEPTQLLVEKIKKYIYRKEQ